MDSTELGLLMSFIALFFAMVSYFVKNKKMYLVFQSLCILFLVLSYFVIGQYFAMIGLAISLVRALIFFAYERLDKPAPIWISFAVSVVTAISYVVVNLIILQNASVIDLILLTSSTLYAFIFRIRDLKTVRYAMLVPTVLSIVYNTIISAPIFLTLSYAFEGVANIVSIFRYHILPAYRNKTEEKKQQN